MAVKVFRDSTDSVNKTTTLKNTAGPRVVLQRGQKKAPAKKFTHSVMNQMKKTMKLSDRGTLQQARKIRAIVGRKAVEPGLAKHLVETAQDERKFLSVTPIKLASTSDGPPQNKEVIHISELGDYVDHICLKRGIPKDQTYVKVLGDTGGNFFKTSISVIDKQKIVTEKKPHKARSTYADATGDDVYKDTSVDKILITGMCAKAKEDYELVSKVLCSNYIVLQFTLISELALFFFMSQIK